MKNAELVKTLKELISKNDYIACDKLIVEHKVAESEHKPLLMQAARVKRQLKAMDEAKSLLLRVIKLFPDTYNAFIQLASIEVAASDFESALEYLDRAELIDSEDYRTSLWRYNIAAATNGNIEPSIVKLLSQKPEFSFPHFKKLFVLYLIQNRDQDAKVLIERYKAALGNGQCLLFQAMIDENEGNVEKALAKLEQAKAFDEVAADVALRLIHIYTQIGQEKIAIKLIEEAIDTGVADHRIYNQVLRLDSSHRALFGKISHWANELPANATQWEKISAKKVLNWIEENNDEFLTQKISKLTDEGFEIQRVLLHDDGSELLVAPKQGAETVMLVFTGLANRAGISVRLLDAYLATLNISVIYLRDNTRLLFNDGIESVADSYEGTLEIIKQRIKELGAKKIICFGNSGGGFAAIRYGIDLNAEKIIGINGVTNVCRDFMIADGRAKIVINRMQKYPEKYKNLKLYIEENPEYTGSITMYYSELVGHDKLQTLNLEGVAGVELRPIVGNGSHDLLGDLEEKGQLMEFLSEMIEA